MGPRHARERRSWRGARACRDPAHGRPERLAVWVRRWRWPLVELTLLALTGRCLIAVATGNDPLGAARQVAELYCGLR